MALIRKELAGSAPGYTWLNDGDVLDVESAMADQLLELPGFSEVYDVQVDALADEDKLDEVKPPPAKKAPAKKASPPKKAAAAKKAAAVSEPAPSAAEESIIEEAAGA